MVLIPCLFVLMILAACGSQEDAPTNRPSTTQSINDTATGQPDGLPLLAFRSTRDGNSEIYVMNADGSDQTRLTTNDSSDECPAWSPDGRKIAFVSRRDGNEEIYVMSPDGSDPTNLTNHTADESYPDWSPNTERGIS